mgnify:CR=1
MPGVDCSLQRERSAGGVGVWTVAGAEAPHVGDDKCNGGFLIGAGMEG